MLIIMLNFMLEKCAYPALCMFETWHRKHEIGTVLSEAKQTEQLKPVTCIL